MKNKKETLWYKVVITVLLILIVILTNLLIDRDIPFSMRFSHEKYGTVDSWVMIIITLITGIAVFFTLNSQMKVQRDQERINKLTANDIRSKYLGEITFNKTQSDAINDRFTRAKNLPFKIIKNEVLYMKVESIYKLECSHEVQESRNGNKYSYTFNRLEKDAQFRLTIVDAKFKEIFEKMERQLLLENSELKPYSYILLEFYYSDNWGFNYQKAFKCEYSRFTGLVTTLQSNIDYL